MTPRLPSPMRRNEEHTGSMEQVPLIRPEDNTVNATTDHDFGTMEALFAALEARCLAADAAETLPYLGMARAELFHQDRPSLAADIDQQHLVSFDHGLAQLDELLTSAIQCSGRLHETLRLTRVRDILREGIDRR